MSKDEKPTRWLVISASGLSVEIGQRDVLVHLQIPDNQLGLAPGLGLALRMTPAETRKFAEALRKKGGRG